MVTQFITLLGRHGLALSRQHSSRFLFLPDLRNINTIRHHTKKHARQPDRQYANRIEDDGLLELGHLARGQTENQDVWKSDGRERDKRVTEEVVRRKAFTREQRRHRRVLNSFRSGAETSHAYTDHDQRDCAEEQKKHRLKSIDPRRAAHAAKEHVAHYHHRDNRAAKPVRNYSVADRIERGATAHDADDDV